MVDELTNETPVFVCSDDASVDVGFFKNGRISEDVGEFKRAELYLKESADADVNYFIKTASEINADLTIADWAAGKKHLSFSLDSVDTNIAKGKKWLAVVLYYGDYGKSTYLAGDVLFVPSGTENEDVTEPEIANLKNEILSLSEAVSEKASEVASAAQSVNEKVLDAESYKNYAAQAAADSLKYRNEAEGFANSAAASDSSALQSANNAALSSQSANASAESAAKSEENASISLQSCEDIETNLEKLAEDVQSTKTEIENKLNEASSLAIEAGNSASIAADKATIAENASVAAQAAVSQVGEVENDVINAGIKAVEEISGIKAEVESAGQSAQSEIQAAKTEATAEISADLASAKTEIAASASSAIEGIDKKGSSYQAQISANAAAVAGAVWTSDASANLGQIVPRKQYPYGYDAWNYTAITRSSAQYTVLGHYLPRSGEFSLFYESEDETASLSGACLKVAEDQKTITWYTQIGSDGTTLSSETLETPLAFGDCLAYVFDCGNVKIYRNKELLFERQIEDSDYLSGNLQHFTNLLLGDNYKQDFMLAVKNALPLEDEFFYSISDFVDGIEPPAGYLKSLTNIDAPFTDATGLTLSQTTGTYSQTYGEETSCAKFVPGGLHATTKRVRYFNFKAPYVNEKNAICKVRMKFYFPTSNTNWKYVGFNPVGTYATWKETSSLLDVNNCISAKDEWQTLEFTLKNGNGSFAPRLYFRPDSGTTTTSAAIGQAISSADKDVFYLAEYIVEYPPSIDNYVKTPTQNGIFIQNGTIPRNMMFSFGMYVSSYGDMTSLGDSGANYVRSTAKNQALTSYPYLYADSFDLLPYGKYCLSSITLAFKSSELSALADTDTITLAAIDSSFKDKTFTKSDILNNQITIHCENPNVYDLRSTDMYWSFSMYATTDGGSATLSGDIIFNWERVS